jgi:hypothetical protein
MQFVMGQEVWLLNPRSQRKKVATGKISGYGMVDKFHFTPIPDNWFKVDVHETLMPDVALMFPNSDAEQEKVKDAVGTVAIWDQKFMRSAT